MEMVLAIKTICVQTPPGAEVDLDGCALVQKDSDLDSYNDLIDAYPNDPTQHLDSDGDGCGDNASGSNGDAFPNDSTQCNDTDGDGYGDNQSGVNLDVYPLGFNPMGRFGWGWMRR